MADLVCTGNDGGDSDSALTLRVVGLFAILVASAVGVWLPWFTQARNLELVTFLGTVFAAGVVLATGFVHILPDGAEALTNPCLGFSGEYPWAEAFAGGSVLVIFSIEYFLRQYLRRKLGLPESYDVPGHAHGLMPEAGAVMSATDGSEIPDEIEKALDEEQAAGQGSPPNAEKRDLAHMENTVAAAMLEMGIVFHSVFVGIDLGISTEPRTARALLIALIFHQGFEGLALGAALVRARCGLRKFTVLAAIFCVITPIGCAIGIGMGTSYDENSRVSLGFNGAFDAVSAGILIYNGLVDLVVPIFTFNTILRGRPVVQVVAIGCLFTGYVLMALLGKWV